MKKKRWMTKIITFLIFLLLIIATIIGVLYYVEVKEIDVAGQVQDFVANFEIGNFEEKENTFTTSSVSNKLNEIQEGSIAKQTSQKEFFKKQLETEAKIFYDAFVQNKEEMKTGTYSINLGDAFSTLLNTETGEEKLGGYYQSAIEAYTYDHPEVFYLSPNKMYLNIETTTKGKKKSYRVYVDQGKNAHYLGNGFSNEEEVTLAIEKLERIKKHVISNRTGNTDQDIKSVHDYLVDTISYDSSVSKANIYDIYGALVRQESVCEGYARAFKYLLDELNIPCVIVIGKGKDQEGKMENHAWNYVQLEEKWYAVDVTWDDPVIVGGGKLTKSSKYKYFLKGSDTFAQDHQPSGNFTQEGKTFRYPDLSSRNYSH